LDCNHQNDSMTFNSTRAVRGFAKEPRDDGIYRQGKDGQWYSYEDLSVANRQFLQNKFELDKLAAELSPAAKRQNNNNNNKRKKKEVITFTTPSRSSARLRTVSPDTQVKSELVEDEAPRPKKKTKRTGKGRDFVELTEEDRANMLNLPDWMEQLQHYLTNIDTVSDQNCRSVMRQVKRMAAGVGITYHHWKEGTFFYRGTKIDLSYDFDTLYDQAVAMENKHGRDLGNGWLMRHPITKLKNFQRYLKEKET
jgi:hypothetical protein